MHTAIFWKYTELFNILKIFSSVTRKKIFLKYIKRSHFYSKKYNFCIRPDQLDFSFCGPTCMVIFFKLKKKISQKNTIKSLLEAKIWFMLSFRNNRKNIVCFYVQQRWLTKSTFSHMVTRVACLQSPRCDRNESESWTLFKSIKFLWACVTFYAI